MEILLIRHGESEGDVKGFHEGKADFLLTNEGVKQAEKMAERVKRDFPPNVIWSSTLKRASQTANILQQMIQCPIIYTDELQEQNNGHYAGKAIDDVHQPFDYQMKPHEKLGEYGESKIELRARAEHILSYILHESKNENRIAIVSHGKMISRIIESFIQLPMLHNVYFKSDNTAIHLLGISEKGRLIQFANNTSHLDERGFS